MPDKPPRAYCNACLRPRSACICGCVRRAASAVAVLILQHPDELRHAKGTARLLHLCLPNSRLLVGEVFDDAALRTALLHGGLQAVLLYPGAENERSDQSVAAQAQTLEAAIESAPSGAGLLLVVIDATWQNSRKMLRCNPALHTLPRTWLANPATTRYRAIRVAHAAHQLSTLEATAHTLAQLDIHFDAAPVLAAFDAFIAVQLRYLPAVRKHHRGPQSVS
jgi:DTW domain-containing protein